MNPITKYRKEYGYSQAQLADLLGVSQSAVSQWELGKTLPDLLTAQKLAVLCGVLIEDLIENADSSSLLLRPATQIQQNFGRLNEAGQKKLLEYAEDLILIEKYKKASVAPEKGTNSDGNH